MQNTGSAQSAQDLILNERCTAALDDTSTPTSLRSVRYSDTTWCMLFNSQHPALSNTLLRQALVSAARQTASLTVDTSIYQPASRPRARGDCRWAAWTTVRPPAIPPRDLGNAYVLYRGARQTVTSSDLMGITILVPESAGLTQAVESINSVWQRGIVPFLLHRGGAR